MLLGYYPRVIANLTIASAYSGVPLFINSPPGTGKTTLVHAVLSEIYGEDSVWSHCFNAGTNPSVVQGAINVRRLVYEGVVSDLKTGTMMDPRYQAVVLDEVVRASDAVAQALIQAMDDIFRNRADDLPCIVALANSAFGKEDEKAKSSLYDAISQRFGMTLEFEPYKPTASQAIQSTVAQMVAQKDDLRDYIQTLIPYPLPTRESLYAMRAATREAMQIVLQQGGFHQTPIANKINQAYRMFCAEDDGGIVIPPRVSTYHAALALYGVAFDTWNQLSESQRRHASRYIAQEIRRTSNEVPGNVLLSLMYSTTYTDAARRVSWVSAVARSFRGDTVASIYNWLLAAWTQWSGDTLLRGVSEEDISNGLSYWHAYDFSNRYSAQGTENDETRRYRIAHAMISDLANFLPPDVPIDDRLHPDNLLVAPKQWVRDVYEAFIRHAPQFYSPPQNLSSAALQDAIERFDKYVSSCEDEAVKQAAQLVLTRLKSYQAEGGEKGPSAPGRKNARR
jgi:hypothetical protein